MDNIRVYPQESSLPLSLNSNYTYSDQYLMAIL